ncbi:MAG TPA: ATP-binding protein [Polyangiaceae bacterium]|nr:ATP-binding protein [Polyangiaceae bacterium]
MRPGAPPFLGPISTRLRAAAGSFLRYPQSSDPADRLSTHLLARIVDLLIAALLLFSAAIVLGAEPAPPQYGFTLPGAFLLLCALRLLIRRDRVRLAARILCVAGWSVIAMDLRVHGPNTVAVGGFVVLILIGGLTLGPAAAIGLATATMALFTAVLLRPVPLGSFAAPSGEVKLVHYVTQLALAAVLVAWWSMQMRRLVRDLRASEARRTLLLEESPDAIASTDALGVITFQNRAAEQILGYPASEVVGRRFDEYPGVMAADGERLRKRVAVLLAGGSVPVRELSMVHRNGKTVLVEARSVALHEEGRVVGVMTIQRDVTARRQAEAERTSLQEQLVTAQRMEAVGRVAGGIAHDFNNMLTVILAAAEAIARDPGHDRIAVDDIREAAAKGASLTRQILTFSRRELSQPRPTDVNRSISKLTPMIARILGQDVTTEIRLAPSAPSVLIDPGQLDQVLVNLAVNARDAMPKGGTFTVSTELREGSAAGKSTVALCVRDTGCGMDAATLAKSFEPFFTTKGEKGTGLGLAVVHGIIRQAGGDISCESEPGRGTAFWLVLPAATDPAEPSPSAMIDVRRQPYGRRVVLIDDDPLVRRAVARTLERAGVVVDALPAATDVTDIAARLKDADALITDVVMPGLTGPDLVDELRRRQCHKPVIFISGYADHELVERVRMSPNSILVTKPFTADAIIGRLDQLRAKASPT